MTRLSASFLLILTPMLASSLLCGPRLLAEEPALLSRLNDQNAQGAELWIYNDLEEAFAQARLQDKPLFVTFRCVPCQACKAFDAEVAQGNDQIHQLAKEKFISVRQVEMKGVDLSQFQFDYDLNWAAMFLGADGVVYARYGTQSAAGPDAYNSIEGLEKTMRRVLALHEAYPRNLAELLDKRGPKKPYDTALAMPGLENKEERRKITTRSNCIHCHNIHDAENLHAQETGAFDQDMLWRYPLPDNLGLMIDPHDGVRIREVAPNSPAARAGIAAGEDVLRIEGQAITSIADMQWALNPLPNDDTTMLIETSRSGRHELELKKGWKEYDISWRGSIWSVQPRLRTWAPELSEAERRKRGLPLDQSAYEVRWINRGKPGGRAVFEAGIRQGDVIVALDGKPVNMKPAQFQTHIKLNYKVGQKLPLTILRDGRKRQVEVELVE